MSQYYAHTTDGPKETWQSLDKHLEKVAKLAKERADVFGAGSFAEWTGLMHDVGKFSEEFQRYLETNRRRVNHSTAGAQLVRNLWLEQGGKGAEKLAVFLSYIIAGHHGGLPDGGATALDSGSLKARLAKKELPPFGAWERHLTLPLIPQLPRLTIERETAVFSLSFLVRMLYSCLTDGDFLDTENFCDSEKSAARGNWPLIEVLAPKLDTHLAKIISGAKDTPVNKARLEILEHCRTAAGQVPGIFSLTVPTGGAKTLSSLAFAMAHAKACALEHGYKIRRIIYVIPYTSIIEQNANVFRDALGEEAVLEHHCNFIHPKEEVSGGDDYRDVQEARRFRLATENWDATLIVTTAVQFFESLFANRSSRCRKLHNIANSVVVFDEAQMLPLNLLQPSVMALRELAVNYGVSLVLCTATQPALGKSGRLTCGFPKGAIREIIPQDRIPYLFSIFRRADVKNLGTLQDVELADLLKQEHQVLCIVNTRKHARDIFDSLGRQEGDFHLSSRMYPAHRKEVLAKIRERLHEGLSCRVVSTSLIECGVDVDFPAVFRALAGLDSIAQAAGRCNREGLLDAGRVYVFRPETGMPKKAPGFLRRAEVYEMVAEKHDDLFSPAAVNDFFTTLYQFEELDDKNIMKNLRDSNKGQPFPTFPFKQISKDYRFMDENTKSVIIERGETAMDLVGKLEYTEHISGILRKLQDYTVQVYEYELDKLMKEGSVMLVGNQFYVARGGMGYREDVGLCIDDPTFMNACDGIL